MQRLIGLLVALALAAPAAANDSSAVLGAGGLTLAASDAIALDREDLFVSADEVRVHYVFRNITGQDVETLVAFPLPTVDVAALQEVPVMQPTDDPVNFVGFRVWVDGREIAPTLETRAAVGDRDVTQLLGRAGLPLTFFDPGFYDRLQTLPDKTKQLLAREGAIAYDPYGVYAQWTATAQFYWPQRFPAGRTVEIEHRYAPVVGYSFFSSYDLDEMGSPGHWTAPYCIDADTARGIRRMLERQGGEYAVLQARTIAYILTTANNWAGPIGSLHLTVDKGDPNSILSLCAEGIAKTGPTTFEATYTGWTPTRDLDVLILSPVPQE